jgi:hypothetical protein
MGGGGANGNKFPPEPKIMSKDLRWSHDLDNADAALEF